jgi:sporulation protein YtfJ
MGEHPIEGLMKTAMESIKEMIEVNTIVGDAVETSDGSIIIPISRVSFGFAAGGGDSTQQSSTTDTEKSNLPFAGGSGAGVSVQPVAFLVVGQGQIRLLPVGNKALYDRLIDLTPQLLEKITAILAGSGNKADEEIAPLKSPTGYQPLE